MFRLCFVHVLDVFLGMFDVLGDVLGMIWACFGHVVGMSLAMVWASFGVIFVFDFFRFVSNSIASPLNAKVITNLLNALCLPRPDIEIK